MAVHSSDTAFEFGSSTPSVSSSPMIATPDPTGAEPILGCDVRVTCPSQGERGSERRGRTAAGLSATGLGW